ncbi:unnamed protein product [Ranitomeya imitator]|nr:unnamed protein product [Ranitomeya imitator]
MRKVRDQPKTTRGELVNDLKTDGTTVTKKTIASTLHRSARKVPLLKKTHMLAHLKFATEHLDDSVSDWEKMLWSDETKIEVFGINSTRHVWRKRNAAYDPKNTVLTVKHGVQPAGEKMAVSGEPVRLERDISRAIELLEKLQRSGEVPPHKLHALQRVLQSDFCTAVREVYEHVYETVDINSSPEVRANATAKATVAAFAASEGHSHPRVVELPKTEEGLGFNIMGGKEQNSPIYISRIIPGGIADRHGGLKRGDQLLSVNGVSVEGEHHEKAVELLKAAQGKVKLVVRYTPRVLEEMESRFEKMRSAKRRQQN